MDWMRWYTNLATDMSLPKVWFEVRRQTAKKGGNNAGIRHEG